MKRILVINLIVNKFFKPVKFCQFFAMFLLIFLVFADIQLQAQTIRYVKEGGGVSGSDGISWETASGDLQAMINTSTAGDQIWVATGAYKPNRKATATGTITENKRDNAFVLKNGVKIYGGFRNDFNNVISGSVEERDIIMVNGIVQMKHETILSGDIGTPNDSTDNCYHVVLGVGNMYNTTVLDGFTVRDGNANLAETMTVGGLNIRNNIGGGISLNSASPILRNIHVTRNTAHYQGNGIYGNNSSPELNNIRITNNYGTNNTKGGGIHIVIGSLKLNNVQISGNTAGESGGGIYCDESKNSEGGHNFNNVQITNNTASSGGGIYSANADSLKLNNVQITGNMANTYGGGIYNYNSSFVLNNVQISGNTAYHYGGGILNIGKEHNFIYPKLTGVNITDNRANKGGGMYNSYCSPILENVKIVQNKAIFRTGTNYTSDGNGGGIFNDKASPVLNNVQVSNNTADNDGGGIYNYYSHNPSSMLTNVQITGNKAGSYGGGMYSINSDPELTNVQITGNKANHGGGICNSGMSSPKLTNITVAGNYAIHWGGITFSKTGPQVFNSIIYGNMSAKTKDNVSHYHDSIYSYSLVEGGTLSSGSTSIISIENPKFVAPAEIAHTNATSDGDYRLFLDSPAIDKGDNDANKTDTDLAGNLRRNGIIDLGAFEISTALVPASNRIYVTVTGAGNQNGSSWNNACRGLAYPLMCAKNNSAIKEIWVAAGTYYPEYSADFNNTATSANLRDKAFVLVDGVKIYGGFFGTETLLSQRDTTTVNNIVQMVNETVLSGDIDGANNFYHVMIGAGTLNNAALDGFTIKGGNANHVNSSFYISVNNYNIEGQNGGGIFLNSTGSPVLNKILITGNAATTRGGGMFCFYSSPKLNNVRITSNTAQLGGGINNDSSSTPYELHNVQITSNTAQLGGGIYNASCSPKLTNVQITCNMATSNGGGMYNYDSSPTLINIQITGNKANNDGGGIYNTESSTHPTLINATVAGNYASGDYGGIHFSDNTTKQVYNSIIYSNMSVGNNTNVSSFSASIYKKSLVEGTNNGGINYSDPKFLIPITPTDSNTPNSGGNYQLSPSSPALDKGVNSDYHNATNIDIDIAGNTRIKNITIDLGAFEVQSDLVPKPASKILYVTVTGKGKKDGSSWDNAYSGLATPLMWAKNNTDAVNQIWVAAGTYYTKYPADFNDTPSYTDPRRNAFVLVDGVKIYGGFRDDLTAANPGTVSGRDITMINGTAQIQYRSILSGDIGNTPDNLTDNCYHVVIGAGTLTATTVLDGFTVSGGYANITGSTDPFIVNKVAINRAYGGGIYLSSAASPELCNVQITSNTANCGGGIFNENSSSTLTNCKITGNTANFNGGGVFNNGSSPKLINVQITGNKASQGGGIYNAASVPVLTNVTVAGNYVTDYYGGIYFSNNSTQQVRNSIIYGNKHGNNVVDNVNYFTTGIYSKSLVEGTNNSGITPADPRFVSPIIPADSNTPNSDGNYQLFAGSPAVDKGDNNIYNNATTINIDLAGNTRIKYLNIDLGAFEVQPEPVLVPANGILYVTVAGKGKKDGSSWDDACRGLAYPLKWAKENLGAVTQIWVAAGTYRPEYVADFTASSPPSESGDNAFVLVNNVKIYGGFANNLSGTEGAPEGRATKTTADGIVQMEYASILSGDIGLANESIDNCYHVVIGVGALASTTVLDGFTIRDGNATGSSFITINNVSIYRTYGGGIFLHSAGYPVLRNILVSKNTGYSNGGGIYNYGSYPVLTDVQITDNEVTSTSSAGGGMYNRYGSNATDSTRLTKVLIKNNKAKKNGGGIYNEDSSPVLNNVQITNNTANNGGGIYNSYSSPVLNNVQITNNTANSGGGIYIYTNSTLKLNNVQITGNKATDAATGKGGGIYATNSFTLINCKIAGNTAVGDGGGIYNTSGTPKLINVQITGNKTNASGGGICNGGTTALSLTNVTIAGNYAVTGYGGIVFGSTASNQVRNSIIYNNASGNKDASYKNVNYLAPASIYTYSLVQDATVSGTNIISNLEPKFKNPKAPASAPTSVSDYQLSYTTPNPAIDAGDNTTYDTNASGVNTDLAGNTRKIGVIDLGAFESLCNMPSPPDVSNVSALPVCEGSTPTIKISATVNGHTYRVYNVPNGGTLLGSKKSTGGVLEISCSGNILADTAYFIETYNGTCYSSSRTRTPIIIMSLDPPDIEDVTACYDGLPHTVSIPPIPNDQEIVWYTTLNGQVTMNPPSLTTVGTITAYAVAKIIGTNCQSERTAVTVTINEKQAFSADDMNVTDITCHGKNNGSITVTLAGVTYYSIDNGGWQESPTFDNLSVGTYSIMVKTSSGCVSDAVEKTVNQPTDLAGGEIETGGAQTQIICNINTPAAITSKNDASGGSSATILYQWQQSLTGTSNWTDVDGATSTDYSPAALTQTTHYRRGAFISGCDTAYSNTVTITIKHHALAGNIIVDNMVICHGTKATLTLNSDIADAGYNWYQRKNDDVPFYTGNEYVTSTLTADTTFYLSVSGSNYCENTKDNRKSVTVKTYNSSKHPDLRIRVCPQVGEFNLSKYIDSAYVSSLMWTGIGIDPDGNVSPNSFDASKQLSFIYTISDFCVSNHTRKAYIEILRNGRIPLLKDTVLLVCYDQAETIQINQIFGIEADGTWKYYADTEDDLVGKTHIIVSASYPYTGSITMNGKAIYDDPSITVYPYLGDSDAKKIVFIYKANDNNCLKNKEYKVTIVVHKN
ncbi:MAG: right-handed parallel beta-helix repeat-containing protein [Prevotellaceae bacterium]|jgi:predicted outer membrane repeat protein|nr:right-handed parallel beta-helix repeat-containing protein [Prevotellaceae bacterium]